MKFFNNAVSNTKLLVLMMLICENAASQYNSYRFVEPNVSLSFDSSILKINDLYGNSESGYGALKMKHGLSDAFVLVEAHRLLNTFSQGFFDSSNSILIEHFNKVNNDTVKMFKPGSLYKYKGFVGFSGVLFNKKNNTYGFVFFGSKLYDGGYCKVFYSTEKPSKIENCDLELKYISSVIDGITTYDMSVLDAEDSILHTKYKIKVDSIAEEPSRIRQKLKKTFNGKVTFEPPIEEKGKKIRFVSGAGKYEFEFNENGECIIYSVDELKGELKKKLTLVLLDRYGREVQIQYTFNYTNW